MQCTCFTASGFTDICPIEYTYLVQTGILSFYSDGSLCVQMLSGIGSK